MINIKRVVIVLLLCILLIGIYFYIDSKIIPFWKQDRCINAQIESNGVIIHGCSALGWISNTNSYPVTIKQVWIFRGETTEKIMKLNPNKIIEQWIDYQHGFYLYKDNQLLDFIKCRTNGDQGDKK